MVQWMTVRIMLLFEILLKLKSKQQCVTVTFLHVDVGKDDNTYVKISLGFRNKRKGSEIEEDLL